MLYSTRYLTHLLVQRFPKSYGLSFHNSYSNSRHLIISQPARVIQLPLLYRLSSAVHRSSSNCVFLFACLMEYTAFQFVAELSLISTLQKYYLILVLCVFCAFLMIFKSIFHLRNFKIDLDPILHH